MLSPIEAELMVPEIKRTLANIADKVDPIPTAKDAKGFFHNFELADTAEETFKKMQGLFTNYRVIRMYTEEFLRACFQFEDYSEGVYRIRNITGYIGRVVSSQLLTYFHSDNIDYRLTASICSADKNPSTTILDRKKVIDFGLSPCSFEEMPYNQVDSRLFSPQAPEGIVVPIVSTTIHSATELPPDTVKLLLVATFEE